MDALGFLLAASVLVATIAAFELLVRLLGGVAEAVRYTVAPSMATGFRSWVDDRGRAVTPQVAADDAGPPGPGSPDGDPIRDATGLVVPIQRVKRDGSRSTALARVVPLQPHGAQVRRHARSRP
jgi:hypothetical protein